MKQRGVIEIKMLRHEANLVLDAIAQFNVHHAKTKGQVLDLSSVAERILRALEIDIKKELEKK